MLESLFEGLVHHVGAQAFVWNEFTYSYDYLFSLSGECRDISSQFVVAYGREAAVHDLTSLLEKFKMLLNRRRTVSFLLFDHIGGVNTMLYSLSNGGCLITLVDRNPDAVLQAVDKHRADLLPTSPTFINLLLLSEAYKRHDLRTLQTVTYGTEPMPESTLKRFHELFPHIALQQTYGLSEVGIL